MRQQRRTGTSRRVLLQGIAHDSRSLGADGRAAPRVWKSADGSHGVFRQDDPPHAIDPIPAGIEGAKTVDRVYEEAYTMMFERAEDIARRWNR